MVLSERWLLESKGGGLRHSLWHDCGHAGGDVLVPLLLLVAGVLMSGPSH